MKTLSGNGLMEVEWIPGVVYWLSIDNNAYAYFTEDGKVIFVEGRNIPKHLLEDHSTDHGRRYRIFLHLRYTSEEYKHRPTRYKTVGEAFSKMFKYGGCYQSYSVKDFADYCYYVDFTLYKSEVNSWRYSNDPLDRHIGKITVKYDRALGNDNKQTFDFIRITCSIMGVEDKMEFCKKNYHDILNKVLKNLESRKRFKRYGVPTSMLAVTKATMGLDGDLNLLFELKPELRKLLMEEEGA